MGQCGAVAALVVSACSGAAGGIADAAADAADVTLSVVVFNATQEVWPDGLTVVVNGEPAAPTALGHLGWSQRFADGATALAVELVVETRLSGTTVGRRSLTACPDCLEELGPGAFLAARHELCGYPSGELRWAAVTCEAVDPDGHLSTCVGDGACEPACDPRAPGACGDAGKCSRLLVHRDPDLEQVACVPGGDVPPGSPCQVGPAGLDTGFDDCAGAACAATARARRCARRRRAVRSSRPASR